VLVGQRCKLPCPVVAAFQRVGDQLGHLDHVERLEFYHIDAYAGLFEIVSERPQAVVFAYFVVTVRADDEKIFNLGICDNVFKERYRCGVDPLKIVDENSQGPLARYEDAYKICEYQVETVFCLLGAKFRDGRLRARYQLDLGDYVDNYPGVLADRVEYGFLPYLNNLVAFREDLPHKAPEGFDHRAVGHFHLKLVAFTGDKEALDPRKRADNLGDKGCFTDSRWSDNIDNFRAAVPHAL